MASTGDTWRLGRRPALDGLRGVAVLLVMLFHARVPWFPAGGVIGVGIFFALSGFLITALLLQEHEVTSAIALRAFYLRRARRLLPAFLASLFVVLLMAELIGRWYAPWPAVLSVLAYSGNWYMVDHGSMAGLGGTWSLGIEEQFYLIWPLILIPCTRLGPRMVATVAGVGAVASAAYRWALWLDGAPGTRLYFGTDTRADALLWGCFLAAILHTSVPRVARTRLASVILGGLVVLCLVPEGGLWKPVVLPTIVPLLTCSVIYLAVRGESVPWLSGRAIRWVGERSYGIYLWHCPLPALLAGVPWPVAAAIIWPVAFVLGEVSWRLIETPFKAGRRRPTRWPFLPPLWRPRGVGVAHHDVGPELGRHGVVKVADVVE